MRWPLSSTIAIAIVQLFFFASSSAAEAIFFASARLSAFLSRSCASAPPTPRSSAAPARIPSIPYRMMASLPVLLSFRCNETRQVLPLFRHARKRLQHVVADRLDPVAAEGGGVGEAAQPEGGDRRHPVAADDA